MTQGAIASGPGALLACMRAGYDAIADAAPDDDTRTEGEAYLTRLAATTLERTFPAPSASIEGFAWSRFPMAGANPDFRMGQLQIDPAGRYLIEGVVHGADRIGFGCYTPTPGAGLELDGYVNLTGLRVTADGSFSVLVEAADGASPTPPRGTGVASPSGRLAMKATSRVLIVRELHKLPTTATAEISVRRLDSTDGLPAAAAMDPFAMAAAQIDAILHQYLRWTELFTAAPNSMAVMPAELDDAVNGDPDTRYYSGAFMLGEGEFAEVTIPDVRCDYWMIQMNNHWLEPLADGHRNDATAMVDDDGVTRIRIAAGPLAARNALDTRGRRRGTLLYRTIDARETVVPTLAIRSRGS
jgi:hypothetical protein